MKTHVLNDAMEKAFDSGPLRPLLEIARVDRDLILEFRGEYSTIYCKGHRVDIRPCGAGYYQISADERAFLPAAYKVESQEAAEAFVNEQLPRVKQAIATHRSCGWRLSSNRR